MVIGLKDDDDKVGYLMLLLNERLLELDEKWWFKSNIGWSEKVKWS